MDDQKRSHSEPGTGLTSYTPMSNAEAAAAAAILIGQFPTSERGDDTFGRALASLFKTFPPSVVADCINSKSGLATETDFLSLHKVHEWCHGRAERFAHWHNQQRRIDDQLRDRGRKPRTERGMAMTQAWLDRTDPASRGEAGDRAAPLDGKYNYQQFLDWARRNGKAPRPIGRFEEVAKPGKRPSAEEAAAARKKLIDEFGQAAFDAVPDQPLTFQKLR